MNHEGTLDISRKVLEEFNEWRVDRGLAPVPAKRTRLQRGLKVSDYAWTNVIEIAARFGYINTHGRTASGGSASDLLEAIGHNLIHVEKGPSKDFPNFQPDEGYDA